MDRIKKKWLKRKKRHQRLRQKVFGTPERPRLSVYRSLRQIYCQLIDDVNGKTLMSISTLSGELKKSIKSNNIQAAQTAGKKLAEEARKKGVEKIVFDRGGFPYHGRIKALAEAARKEGLKF